MSRQVLDMTNDKLEELFQKTNGNFEEVYQKDTELDQKNASQDAEIAGKASQADYNTLKARVDLLTQTPSGETEGNAELIDIRVGADGKTYSTAGEAVRAIAEGKALVDDSVSWSKIFRISGKSVKLEQLAITELEDAKWYFDKQFVGYNLTTFLPEIRGSVPGSVIVDFKIPDDISKIAINKKVITTQAYVMYTAGVRGQNGGVDANIAGYVTNEEDYLVFNVAKYKSVGFERIVVGGTAKEFELLAIDRDMTDLSPQVKNWVNQGMLQDGIVGTSKLEDSSVTKSKLQSDLVQLYPFDNNSDFKKTTKPGFYRSALLFIELYGTDPNKDYYVYDFWSKHQTQFTRVLRIKDSDGSDYGYYSAKNDPEDVVPDYIEYVYLRKSQSASSKIVGRAVIDWSKVIFQEYAYPPTAGLLSRAVLFQEPYINLEDYFDANNNKIISKVFDNNIHDSFVFTGNVLSVNSGKNRWSNSYDTETLSPNWLESSNVLEYTLPVSKNQNGSMLIGFSTNQSAQWYLLDEDYKVLSNSIPKDSVDTLWGGVATRTEEGWLIPFSKISKAKYLSIVFNKSDADGSQFFAKYSKSYIPDYLDLEYISDYVRDTDVPEFVLPAKLRVVLNHELNIFYNNLIRYIDTDKMHFVKSWGGGVTTYNKFGRLLPTSNVSDKRFGVNIYDRNTNSVTYTDNVVTELIDEAAGSGLTKKILFIGDSLTDAGQYTAELVNLFSDDSMNIELLGTRGAGTNKHEGHSGWRAYTYVKCANNQEDWDTWGGSVSNVISNPFYNSETENFDFEYYMETQGYDNVDYVFICLGTNDIARGNHQSDEELLEYYNTMINSIKSFNSSIKIGVWLPPTRGLSDNNFKGTITNSLKMNKFLIENYDSRESENIYLVPVYMNVDPYHDYNTAQVPVTSRSSDILMTINSPDAVHPKTLGYQHIADLIYGYIKYFGSLDSSV